MRPKLASSMTKRLYRIKLKIVKIIAPIFFDKKYLRGKFFEDNTIGWRWVMRSIIWQRIFGFNCHVPWPVSPHIVISDPQNIEFDVDNLDNFQGFGNYFQSFGGKIYIGKGALIAPNVGIITTNHDITNEYEAWYEGKDVVIGKNCWIGMNSMILPGVVLGDNTIVGAGAVVTKSFPEGYSIIAGNPARLIKHLMPPK
jgi:acetyltransferase-like isoleucine patch superfamily enzyme